MAILPLQAQPRDVLAARLPARREEGDVQQGPHQWRAQPDNRKKRVQLRVAGVLRAPINARQQDEAGEFAAVVGPSSDDKHGILSTHLYADGTSAEDLWVEFPSSKAHPRLSAQVLEEGRHYPKMEGRKVFKNAVSRLPEVVMQALKTNGYGLEDLSLLVPHQANLRINEFVQKSLGLPDEKVFNNIQKYGNTTAATIPLCLDEALKEGRIKRGDLVCLAAFGAGFTWGSALIRW